MSKLIFHKKFEMPYNTLPVSDTNGEERLNYLKSVASILTDNTSLVIKDDLSEAYPYPTNLYASNIYLGFEDDPIPKIEIGNSASTADSYIRSRTHINMRTITNQIDGKWKTEASDEGYLATGEGCIMCYGDKGYSSDPNHRPSHRQGFHVTPSETNKPIEIHILKFRDGLEIITFKSFNRARPEYAAQFSMVITNVIDLHTDNSYKTIIFFRPNNMFTSYITELNGTSYQLDGMTYAPSAYFNLFAGSMTTNIPFDAGILNASFVGPGSDVLIESPRMYISKRLYVEIPDVYIYSNRIVAEPGDVIKIGDNRYYCFCMKYTNNNSPSAKGIYYGADYVIKID